jgi:hypothetical protein
MKHIGIAGTLLAGVLLTGAALNTELETGAEARLYHRHGHRQLAGLGRRLDLDSLFEAIARPTGRAWQWHRRSRHRARGS